MGGAFICASGSMWGMEALLVAPFPADVQQVSVHIHLFTHKCSSVAEFLVVGLPSRRVCELLLGAVSVSFPTSDGMECLVPRALPLGLSVGISSSASGMRK